MIGHDFPYLDTRDLNLDWILRKVKALVIEWAEMQGKFTDLNNKFDDLKNFVTDYFDSLDIQEEVSNKLEEMRNNGELSDLIYNDFLPLNFTRAVYSGSQGATSIYYCRIPSEYKPKIRIANNQVGNVSTATEHAYESKATILVNGSTFTMATGVPRGLTIIDGTVYTNEQITTDYDRAPDTLYCKDGILNCISALNPNDEVINQNPDWALFSWYKFAENGVFTATDRDPLDFHPRTCIAQDNDNNYLLLCCDGRSPVEKGMSLRDLYTAMTTLIGFIPRIAYNLDGGGSVAAIDHGIKVNKYINNENRKIPVALYFAKETVLDNNTFLINKTIAYQLERGIREDARHTLNPQFVYHNTGTIPMIRFMEIVKDGSDWSWDRGTANIAFESTNHFFYVDGRAEDGFKNFLKVPVSPNNNENIVTASIMGKLIGQFFDTGMLFTNLNVSTIDDIVNSGYYMINTTTAYPETCPITGGRSILLVFGNHAQSSAIETLQILGNAYSVCWRCKSSGIWQPFIKLSGANIDTLFSTAATEYKNGIACFDSTNHKTYTYYNGVWYDAMGNAR